MYVLRAIIKKELLAMSRDVHGLLVLFLMPAAFILVMSLALRDTFELSVAEKVRWQACDQDGSPRSAALIARLPPRENSTTAETPAELEQALSRGDIQMAVVIAPGFGEALADPDETVARVTLLAEPGTPPALVGAFRAELTSALSVQRIETLLQPLREAAESAGATLPDVASLSREDLHVFRFHQAATRQLNAVQQSVPAWLVFAMFFVVIPLSTIFIAEKQHGTLPRLRALQVSTLALLAGKVIPFYLINLLQTALMLLVGRYVVPLLGGEALQLDVNGWALWMMASAVSLAAIGFALLIAAATRTTEQATTIGGVANILFGALGGVMVPKLVMPATMQAATDLSPMAWGLNGFIEVFARGGDVVSIAGPALALGGFGALCFALATWRLRRR